MEIGRQITGNEMPPNERRRRRKYQTQTTATSQSDSRRQLSRRPASRQRRRTSSYISSDQLGPFKSRQQQQPPPLEATATTRMNHISRRLLAAIVAGLALVMAAGVHSSQPQDGNLRFDSQTSAYQGLTFTFDPRLDKQVEQRLHFEHWLDIMQQASSLLYESLNGQAHLAEIKVLIPFKWRQLSAELRPVLYKPGAPVIANRRLRFAQSDVIVGLEDPIYKETPFAVQHDECGRPGLNIRMPISFLDQQRSQQSAANKLGPGQTNLDARLKARQFVREFASHRFGIFKESGFRSDFMYPPFSSAAGFELNPADQRWSNESRPAHYSQHNYLEQPATAANRSDQWDSQGGGGGLLRGFDEHFRECKFETSPASGLPANAQAANCLPYLMDRSQLNSFNLMASDPFSYGPSIGSDANGGGGSMPLQWQELAEQTKWHFCGENFATNLNAPQPATSGAQSDQSGLSSSISTTATTAANKLVHYEHNQRAANKQNRMCQERSALEVIQMSEDFSKPVSAPSFNRLPKPSFTFLQEMPPRVILCLEYTSHLFLSRQQIIGSAINKFLALDLVAESELAMVVFGQHQSRVLGSSNFRRLDSNQEARLLLFNPSFELFDEQLTYYTAAELSQLDVQTAPANSPPSPPQQQQQPPVRVLKGSCSLAKMMAEVNGLLQKSSQQYDDVGADLVVLTSGLFVEDEQRIEEILRSSNFKLEHNRLNMIIYPSNLLFDTKSHDRLIVLDSNESERIIRARLNKLLLVQRLTGGRLHLVREQLDSLGDVKMSTLAQFYQIFEQLASGHSWDQTNALVTLQSQQVDSRQNSNQQQQPAEHKLTFQFNLDESIQNELIVGFMEPKARDQQQQHQHQHQLLNMVERQTLVAPSQKQGKKFTLKNLQLRSPGGQFVFTETNTTWNLASSYSTLYNASYDDQHQLMDSIQQESAWFPFRAQLSLAGFHVRAEQLSQLAAVRRLAGTWTLSALSDEPLQTSGLAMARANPQGDTLMGNCWLQTYTRESIFDREPDEFNGGGGGGLKMVKVFAQISGGSGGQRQEVEARLEVQDEMGNIVQNAQMLDDGLGAPDMTQNDGIFTQYVQRATRSGFYKVSVELSTGHTNAANTKLAHMTGLSGQDNVCCGSFIPLPAATRPAGHSSKSIRSTRQLYCGTFFVDTNNRLAQQRPPRVSNLTIANVEQEQRRVTLRWFEPRLDIASGSRVPLAALASGQRFAENSQLLSISSESDLMGEEAAEEGVAAAAAAAAASSQQVPPLRTTRSTGRTLTKLKSDEGGAGIKRRQIHGSSDDSFDDHQDQLGRNVLMASHQQERSAAETGQNRAGGLLQSRYEIKLFFDRDIAKRTFDSKEVAYKFTEWNVEGQFPNASHFGGLKEITLRIPFAREGLYFVAMKVYNNQGQASQMSNIAQFYLRHNVSLDEAESIWSQPGMTMDADGNVYDKNGDLVQRAGGSPLATNQLGSFTFLRGATALDGLSVLVLISVLVFVMVVVCVTLVACLASSARHQLKNVAANKTGRRHSEPDEKKMAGSGSSIVSSSGGCESSEAGTSSLAGSCSGGPTGNHLQQQQQQQQQQHHLLIDQYNQPVQESYHKMHHQMMQQQPAKDHTQFHHYLQEQQQQQQQLTSNYAGGPNHTIVNGYTYATVQQPSHNNHLNQNLYQSAYSSNNNNNGGDVNQNGLDASGLGEPSSWPADVLLSHYDKVKQARERNEAPPVMRIEQLEQAGLPAVPHDAMDGVGVGGGAVQQQQQQQHPYYNQALHQQLSSVLKLKRQTHYDPSSSPALDGITSTTATDSDQTDGLQASHYLYYATSSGLPQVDENGLANQLTDPSIYSQTTNLQQVQTMPMNKDSSQLNGAGYYANQPWSNCLAGVAQPIAASMISSSIYSPTGSATDSQQQLGGGREATISEV